MSASPHLLIPCAAHGDEACRGRLQTLRLPHFEKLLSRMVLSAADTNETTSFSPPHERALAHSYGLVAIDGQIPWAAWQARQEGRGTGVEGEPWAWITPCHWQMGTDRAVLLPPLALQLGDAESQALMTVMQGYFEQDGIQLTYDAPTRWLARGALFADVQTASLDRAVGQSVDAWLPRGASARTLRRLQSEMQMLLYTHPLNAERESGGLLPVNSFWVSGAGALPPGVGTAPKGLRVTHYLRDAAMLGDWDAWSSAWQVLDTGECARLLKELEQGLAVSLTLCGDTSARTYVSQPLTLWQRLTHPFHRKPASAWLADL